MTYNVFGGTLNIALSIFCCICITDRSSTSIDEPLAHRLSAQDGQQSQRWYIHYADFMLCFHNLFNLFCFGLHCLLFNNTFCYLTDISVIAWIYFCSALSLILCVVCLGVFVLDCDCRLHGVVNLHTDRMFLHIVWRFYYLSIQIFVSGGALWRTGL